jgi:Glycosyltransferase family 87
VTRRALTRRATRSGYGGLRTAAIGLLTVSVLGALPIVALTTMFVVARAHGPFSGDFHHELYPEAKLLLEGTNPFPNPDWDPLAQPNLIWPPLAAYLVAPLTILPLGAAEVVVVLLGLLCFGLALWVIGVRDWRVYGAFALWPEVVGEMRVAHLTPVLMLLVALAWRYRDRLLTPGLLVGLAVGLKFFVWPVVVWFAATARYRQAAIAALVSAASVLLVLPHIGLHTYVRELLQLGQAFDQDSYNVFGLVAQAGGSDGVARAATVLVGTVAVAAMWRYRSFTLAIVVALVVSPIVWLDYFTLAALPLALARPRFSLLWLLPIVTWGLEGAGVEMGDVAGTLRLLVVFAILAAVSFASERRLADGRAAGPSDRRAVSLSPLRPRRSTSA